jgi:hypothetical protein
LYVDTGCSHLADEAVAGSVLANHCYRKYVERRAGGLSAEQHGDIVRYDVQLAVIAYVEQSRGTALVPA